MRKSLAEQFPGLRAFYRRLPIPRGARAVASRLLWGIEQRLRTPPQGTKVAAHHSDAPRPKGRTRRRPQQDVVVFAIIDWHFRFQRPQQLARELAKHGHRVFYLTVNLTPAHQPGYACEDIEAGIQQISLHINAPLVIYTQKASADQSACLRAGLAKLKAEVQMGPCIHLVQHPFWAPLASCYADAQLIYDCMDHHAGFHADDFIHAEAEQQFIREADLCVTSATALWNAVQPLARRTVLIRNAGDSNHFSDGQMQGLPMPTQHTVGYYGAIADWFDLEALRIMASSHPNIQFELIGDDTVGAALRLRSCKNVSFLGEQPYSLLPALIQHWSLALIPFQRIPLTLATNPVKVYEYLGAAKAVLATRLPELEPMTQELPNSLWLANRSEEFAHLLPQVLRHEESPEALHRRFERVAFAEQQTWQARGRDLLAAIQAPQPPRVTAIVVSFNQWCLTERCLESLCQSETLEPLEIIVVDNASTDETPERLRAWEDKQHQLGRPHRALLLERNRGFGGGVNEGLRLARGEFLAILNNDLVLSDGWARCLRRHLERDPGLGLICPTTNHIGNEAQVWLPGSTPESLLAAAHLRCLEHAGESISLHVAAFFCVMMPKRVFEAVGFLDESYFPGYFEDDDYCYRTRAAGFEIACAEDAYVFHELSASFNLEGREKREALLNRNRKIFESKWGPWRPHQYRSASLPPK